MKGVNTPMTANEAVICPHCQEKTSVLYDTEKYAVQDVHVSRKPFGDLQDFEVEKDFTCDHCDEQFFATLILIEPVDEIAVASHESLRKKRWSFK